MFNDNNLKLPKSTSIEVIGQNLKKEYFILAKTFEHQAAEGRRKNVTKMKTKIPIMRPEIFSLDYRRMMFSLMSTDSYTPMN